MYGYIVALHDQKLHWALPTLQTRLIKKRLLFFAIAEHSQEMAA